MQLKEILDTVEPENVSHFRDFEVVNLSYDSRLVQPGQAFFCIKGLVTDGHLFVDDAISRGAEVLFVERDPEQEIPPGVVMVKVRDTRLALAKCSAKFYGEPSQKLKLVGVTGTNGKTTTAFLIENIFKKAGRFTGLIGTVENHIGDVVEQVTRTTPESLDLQRLLRRMVDVGVEVVAMEVSSHALELHRASGCKFDVVVFTNLTQDHLDFHISLEEYFGAKKRLFEGEEFGAERLALVNIDDEFGRKLISETTLRSRSFGLGTEADVRAGEVDISSSGNRFTLSWDNLAVRVSTVLQGRFNVYNCLAAAGAAAELGADADSVVSGLERLAGVPGRFENVDCGQPFTALVDYAHTPDGIRNVLEACREVSGGRVIIVVGCGGDRDRSKRPLMGSVAVELSDRCIITSDNPRGEDPGAIIEMIVEGVRDKFPPERYTVVVDRREAIKQALLEASPGDLVVVAGKGHESGQIFSDRVIQFDDRQVVRECLREVTDAQC
jgi:UDP-N-acetylmuramoyl-L-alanyl-D-glutamate--2,6-diaminopimelate ligase